MQNRFSPPETVPDIGTKSHGAVRETHAPIKRRETQPSADISNCRKTARTLITILSNAARDLETLLFEDMTLIQCLIKAIATTRITWRLQ